MSAAEIERLLAYQREATTLLAGAREQAAGLLANAPDEAAAFLAAQQVTAARLLLQERELAVETAQRAEATDLSDSGGDEERARHEGLPKPCLTRSG